MIKYVGVDISKEKFDVCSSDLGGHQYSNNSKGFSLFKKRIGPHAHVVMEASGPYYLRLAHDLFDSGIAVSVINPLVIRRFCQMNLQRAKTDSKDALAILRFAELTKPSAWHPPAEHLQQLLQMQSVMEQLTKQLISTRNALSSLHQHPVLNQFSLKALKKVEQLQQEQIIHLEKQILDLIQQHYNSEFKNLVSIPGIGKKTAVLLILSTHGFKRFENIKQLVAFTGISPRIFQSGKTVNRKPRISKLGMGDLRKSLFMCALQAIKCNLPCSDLFTRLRQKGKAAKVALMAVCHKLLRQAFAVVKNDNLFETKFYLPVAP